MQLNRDEKRTSLEKKSNQLDLDIDVMFMDEASSSNQVTTVSSEKAYFEEVVASGRVGSKKAQGSAAIS